MNDIPLWWWQQSAMTLQNQKFCRVGRLLELCSKKLNHIIHVTIYENARERERGVVEGANAEEASVSLLWTEMAQDTTYAVSLLSPEYLILIPSPTIEGKFIVLSIISLSFNSFAKSIKLFPYTSCSYNDRWNPSQFSNMATETDPHISYLIIDQSEDHKKWTHPEQLRNSCLYSRRHQQITVQL